MKYIRINEIKFATIILLEKISDMCSFEYAHSGDEWGEKDAYSINEFITLSGKDYKIGHDVFIKTLADLETSGFIRLLDHMPFSVNEILKDSLEYALEEREINSLFSEKDLDNNDVFEYEIAIKNLSQIEKKIKDTFKKTETPIINQSVIHKSGKRKLFSGELKPEIVLGNLASYSDGSIRHNGEHIKMPNQIKDLCRLFMMYHQRVITIDDIKSEIINADKRKNIPNETISKYVSKLRNSLKIHFKKNIIFNQKEEGWYMQLK